MSLLNEKYRFFDDSGTSSNLRNQAPLFTELCLLQATLNSTRGTATENRSSDRK